MGIWDLQEHILGVLENILLLIPNLGKLEELCGPSEVALKLQRFLTLAGEVMTGDNQHLRTTPLVQFYEMETTK